VRLVLSLVCLLLLCPPAHAEFWSEVGNTINGSVVAVGRATASRQSAPKTPDQLAQSLSTQISHDVPISPQAATDLLADLKGLDPDRLDTVAAEIGTCIIVNCRGMPAAKVASLVERIAASLRDAANLESAFWTRGVAILSAGIALLSVLVNLTLGLPKRKAKPEAG